MTLEVFLCCFRVKVRFMLQEEICFKVKFVELLSKFKLGPKRSGPLALRGTTPSISSVLLIDEGVGFFLSIYTDHLPHGKDAS